MKKLLSLLLVLTMILSVMSVLVACDSGDPDDDNETTTKAEPLSKTKTQLYVSNYDGGYGTEWLYAVKERFEAEFAETVFEEGKKGVQIIIHEGKDGYYGIELQNKMAITSDEVFFSESNYYYDYVASGYVLDISDIVTALNTDGKTIESMLTEEQENFLCDDGHYYALPHYSGFAGINYDMDLFHQESLYYAKNGTPSETGYTGTVAYTNEDGVRSAGPDGIYGTYDDGLPATYEDFFALCGYMKNVKGIMPFTLTGQYNTTYSKWILSALAANYEGKEQTVLNFSFDGLATNLATVKDGQIVLDTTDTQISNENGYEVYRQAGRYYALSFLEQILDNGYLSDSAFGGTSHVSAQTQFLRSSQKGEPIAMILEGIWWANEAENADVFKEMEKRYGEEYSSDNRRFGFMPLPKATNEKIGEKSVILDNHNSYAFINSKIAESKVELAKKFLQYCYTDISLAEFTAVTGLPKAVTYDLPADFTFKNAYSESVWNLYHVSDVVYPVSQNNIFLSAQSTFGIEASFVTSTENSAINALYNGTSSAEFFAGIINLKNQSAWNASYSKYFN